MPLAVRKIDNKILWEAPLDEEQKKWLGERDLCADALEDLFTVKNTLSIFLIDENVSEERIFIALSAARNSVQDIDYVIFDLSACDDLEIECTAVEGDTPDNAVNKVHRDLIQLTATKVAALGNLMKQRGQTRRVRYKTVGRSINSSIGAGSLDLARMDAALKESLQKEKYAPR